MDRNTANVSFYCRESKKNKDGMAPIELSLGINGKRCYVQLPRKENPTTFKRDLKCKKDNDLKEYLRLIRVRLNEIETAFLRDGHSTTRITQHYAKLLKNSILEEVKDAFEKSYWKNGYFWQLDKSKSVWSKYENYPLTTP